MKVRISPAATADLRAIGDWIGEDNPLRGATFVEEIVERCLSLSHHPERFPVAHDVGGRSVRKVSFRDYLMFYEVSNEVLIVRIVHGSRNWAALFDE